MTDYEKMPSKVVFGLIILALVIGAIGGYSAAPEKITEVEVPVEVEVEVEVPVEVETIVTVYASLSDLAEDIRTGEVDVGDDYTMALDGRYHTIHSTELELGCLSCHVGSEYGEETQYQRSDKVPIRGAVGVVDRAICLGCHRENGIAHELFGSQGN